LIDRSVECARSYRYGLDIEIEIHVLACSGSASQHFKGAGDHSAHFQLRSGIWSCLETMAVLVYQPRLYTDTTSTSPDVLQLQRFVSMSEHTVMERGRRTDYQTSRIALPLNTTRSLDNVALPNLSRRPSTTPTHMLNCGPYSPNLPPQSKQTWESLKRPSEGQGCCSGRQ
jgi:hypothetical protein